jgi:integrase
MVHDDVARWSPATVLEHRRVIDTKLGVLKRQRLDQITPGYVDEFYSRLRAAGGAGGRPLSPASVRRIHVIVRAALEQGVRWNWIAHNPAQRAYTGRVRAPQNRVPQAPAVARLLREAWAVDPDLAVVLTLEAYTGIRRGELLALRWSDLDVAAATVTITRAIARGPEGLVEKQTTKTGRERRIALAPESVVLLVEHRQRCAERAAAAGARLAADSYVFSPEIDGSKPWWPTSVSRSMKTLCRSAGIEAINFRELRRFVASTMVTGGVDMSTETEMLGHGPTVALTHYARSDRAAQERASRVVVDALNSASATTSKQS